MTLIDRLSAPQMEAERPMTADEFCALHPDTQVLVVAGNYRDTWPSAWHGYIAAAAERDFIAIIDLMVHGIKLKIH